MAEKPTKEAPAPAPLVIESIHLSVLRELATFGASEEDLFTPEERNALIALYAEKFVQRGNAVFGLLGTWAPNDVGLTAAAVHAAAAAHEGAVPMYRIAPRGVKELMQRNRSGRMGK